jgi:GDP-4-dehydro-6-deoxy-D-mannose reductase
MRAIRLRPFKHTGPGQSEDYVVSAFAAQIARIERGEQAPVMQIGSRIGRRDLADVRDASMPMHGLCCISTSFHRAMRPI